MLTRNTGLFNRIADAIELRPESHNQKSWGCGTAFCIAGYAAHLEGCKSTIKLEVVENWASEALGLNGDDEGLFEGDWTPPKGMTVPEALRAIGRGAEINVYEEDE